MDNLQREGVAPALPGNGNAPPAGPARATTAATGIPFLAVKGEMGRRVRDFDWRSTPLGPLADWPQSLKTAVGMMLLSPVPIVMLWG